MSYLVRLKPIFASFAILLTIATALSPLLAQAQQYVPPKRGIPGRREGAGTRGPKDRCIQGDKPLLALAPADNFGLTTSKTPTILWYIPSTMAATAEFGLLDDSDEEIYVTTVALKQVPGVFKIQIPANVAREMKPEQSYRWQFSLICNSKDPSRNPFVEGWIERAEINTELAAALRKAKTPQTRASIYASAGVWQDAIATLAEARCAKPNDFALQTSWETLLTSVELKSLVQAPLTQACSSTK